MQNLLKINAVLSSHKEVAIISHYNPDGDALGSQIALSIALQQKGIKTLLLNRDEVPSNYFFLHDTQLIKRITDIDALPKVLIFVDCATFERTGLDGDIEKNNNFLTINIDHHISNSYFADINWVDESAAATGELIYDLLGILQVKVSQNIATALYTAISTDTGSFLYENTTSLTHRIASDLINKGADLHALRVNYYENTSKNKLKLLKYALNNVKFALDDQIAWTVIDKNFFESIKAEDADSEGLISYIKNISGVEVALVFREIDNELIKVSLRSKKWFDVNIFAKYFNGGGHAKASGCTLKTDLNTAVNSVIDMLKEKVTQGGK